MHVFWMVLFTVAFLLGVCALLLILGLVGLAVLSAVCCWDEDLQ